MLVVREFCKFGDEHDFVRPWPCYSAVELSRLLGRSSCCSLFVNVIHKFAFEDLKRLVISLLLWL